MILSKNDSWPYIKVYKWWYLNIFKYHKINVTFLRAMSVENLKELVTPPIEWNFKNN